MRHSKHDKQRTSERAYHGIDVPTYSWQMLLVGLGGDQMERMGMPNVSAPGFKHFTLSRYCGSLGTSSFRV